MMASQDACHTSSQLSIQSGKNVDNTERATQARSRSTSAGSSAGGSPGSNFSSIGVWPDLQGAIPAGPSSLSHLNYPEAFFDIDRCLLLGGFGKEDKPALKGICPPPGLEDATPAARSLLQSQDYEHDNYGGDDFACVVASLAVDMALGSPTSTSGKPISAAPLEAIGMQSPALSLDTLTHSGAVQIPGAPGFPPPPPSQAPILGAWKGLPACAPLAQAPTLAPQTKPPTCAPPTQPPVLSTYTNVPTCDPPAQPPTMVAHMQRAPMLPPPALPPNMSGKFEEPQLLPAPLLPPSLSTCRSQPPLVPPPCQPPVLRAEMPQPFERSPCRPSALGAEMQTPVDVLPPTQAPNLRLTEAFPELAPGASLLPSAGSEGHQMGTCRPCAFFHSKGCDNGAECQFCHLCTRGEKKRRMKDKRRGELEQRGQGA